MSEEPTESEPHLGRFLASFVLLPGAIVLVCLSILVGIQWLSHSATTPRQLVDTIERREGNVRWRAAVQLAGMLADPDRAELRQDRQLAQRLTALLRRELQSGGTRQEDSTLLVFLCRVLGEFESDVSLPALVDAARPQQEPDVRRSAIEAVALLTDTLGSEQARAVPGLQDSLLAASRDPDPLIRLSAAYALGVLGGTQAEERLTAMLPDENTLVRYNAATGLARSGNAAALDILLEMLAPELSVEELQRELIHVNALEAIRQLIAADPDVSCDSIREAVEHLNRTSPSTAVQVKIAEIRKLIPRQ